MKSLLQRISVVCVVCTAAACSGAQPTGPIRHTGQIITVTDAADTLPATDTIRIGHLHSGEIVRLPLQLANATKAPFVLISHRTNCGCTRLEYGNQPLMPGDTLTLNLTFDSRGAQGWQFKNVDLILSDRDRPRRIYIEADIE